MASEGVQGVLRELYGASLAILRWLEHVPALGQGERAPDLQRTGLQVHIFPTQPQQLALPQAAVYGQNVKCFETVPAYGFEERSCLLRGEGVDLLPLGPRGLDAVSDVAGDQPVRHGVLQGLAQRGVDVLNCPGTRAALELLAVQATRVGSSQVLELDAPQRWLDVYPNELLVALPGPLPDRVTYVGQPAVKILA